MSSEGEQHLTKFEDHGMINLYLHIARHCYHAQYGNQSTKKKRIPFQNGKKKRSEGTVENALCNESYYSFNKVFFSQQQK